MTATAALVLAALASCAAAALAAVPARLHRSLPYLLLAAGAVLLAVAGLRADLGLGGRLGLGSFLGFGPAGLDTDRLSGLFLAVTGVVATPVMLAFSTWSRRDSDVPYRSLPAVVALTLAGVVVVESADSAYLFLFGWEAVSVAFYLLASYRRDRPGSGRAGMLTFAFSKASGALLLISFLLLSAASGSFRLASWSSVTGPAHTAAYTLALLACAIKVGVVPVQIWMPTGYAAAPGPARALMSAVAANIGYYTMWRLLDLLGRPPVWLALVLLLAAAVTALLGIAHAAVGANLPTVVAFSSVENGGLISAGYAIALAGAATGQPRLVALGLLASGLQMVAHALAKSSLFLAVSRLEQTTGRQELDQLLGCARGDPAAAAAFALGAFTLAGLPLTVGFVSEWFLLESVMQLFRVHQLALQLSLAAAGAALALTAGYAGFTFVRLVGLTVLGGEGRPRRAARPRRGALGTAGVLLPALACVAVAALTPGELRLLSDGAGGIVAPAVSTAALASPWVVQPVYAGFSALSPSWLAVELPVLAGLVLLVATVLSRGGLWRVRRVPPWRSATGGVAGDARYTSFAFANPTRHVLSTLLLTRSQHVRLDEEVRAGQEAASAFDGPDLPGGRPVQAPQPARAAYNTDVVEIVETLLYRPALRPVHRLVGTAKRLQSGRLDAYVLYMLLALVALVAVVVALS